MKTKAERYNELYIDIALRIAEMSYATRLHVGAVLVKDNNIISFGWNGMPSGWDNTCEYEELDEYGEYTILKTKPEVLHAEQNALMKLAKSTSSSLDSEMYITHAPCVDCAKLICQSGVNSIFYRNAYRDDSGIELLKKAGINVNKI